MWGRSELLNFIWSKFATPRKCVRYFLRGRKGEEGARAELQAGDRTCTCIEDARFDTTKPFQLEGTFDCKVVRVYDGDTIWVAISGALPQVDANTQVHDGPVLTVHPIHPIQSIRRVCCRLIGIDAPEMPRSHHDAMTESSKSAFRARDRLVELVTSCRLPSTEAQRARKDAQGLPLPSLSDAELQSVLDRNCMVLLGGLHLMNGTDKYGRYLARISTSDDRDVSQIMLDEGLAQPYDGHQSRKA